MTVKVEVAWGSTYQTASPTWSDITDHVLDITIDREAHRKSDGVSAGKISVTADNRDDAFTPAYSGSANYPNVVPGLPVRVSKTTGGVYYVATAYVETFRPDVTGRPPTCTLEAYDLLRIAKAVGQPRWLRDVVVADSPRWYWTFDRWGGSSNDRAIDESSWGAHQFWSSDWPSATGAIVPGIIPGQDGYGLDCSKNPAPYNTLAQTMSGALIGAGNVDYSVEVWWDRNGATVAGGGVWYYLFHQLTAGGSDEIGLAFQSDRIRYRHNSVYVDWLTNMTTKFGPMQIVARHLATGAVELYVNGALQGTPASNTGWVTAANEYIGSNSAGTSPCTVGVLDQVAVWDGTALSAAQIADHYDAGSGGPDELSGARVGRIADVLNAGIGTDSIDTGGLYMDPCRTVSLLEQLADVAKAESGILSTSTDGGIRFRSGLRTPPTPRTQTMWFGGMAHWACDEPSGSAVADILPVELWGDYGAPWNATLTGGYTRGQPSLLPCHPAAYSTELNGSSGYGYVAHDADWDSTFATTTLAVGAWIRPDVISGVRPIIARSNASAVDWALYVNSSGKLVFEYVNSSGTTRQVVGTTTLAAGQTYHVMGLTDGQRLKVYLNGVADGTTTISDTPRYTSGRQVWIGRRTTAYFDGRVQHVFWNLCWIPTESQQDEWAQGMWRAGQPRWTFTLDGTGVPYEAAAVEYDDDGILAAATIAAKDGFEGTAPPVTVEGTAVLGDRLSDSIEAVKSFTTAWPDTIKATTMIDRRGSPRLAVTALDLVPDLARAADMYRAAVLDAGPVAYWRFDDGSGNFADASGNGHALTAVGAPTYGADGALEGDSAVSFGTTGDRATHVNHADFVTASLTVCGWLKPINAGSLRYLFQRVDGANGFNWTVTAGNVMRIAPGTDLSAAVAGSTAITAGQWWWWAVTITNGAQKIWLYNPVTDTWIDDATGTATFTPTSTASLTLSSGSQAAPGTLDDWCWYDRVLTETELQALIAAATNPVWDAIVQMQLGDRVLVEHTTPSGAGIDTAGWITEIAHSKQGRVWATRIGIEP